MALRQPKSSAPFKLKEADLERAASDLLELDGWRTLKTDPVSRREWGKGFGELGMADRLYIRYQERFLQPDSNGGQLAHANAIAAAAVMWIEWKRPGGKATTTQKMWHTAERARGALTLIAGEDFTPTFEGFREWYLASGLMRRLV